MASSALIVIDMLNPYEHDDADELAGHVEEIVDPLRRLIERARESDAELVYVNDNYGDFAASRDQLVERALAGRQPHLVEPIVPSEESDLLQKVRHSAFYSTSLEYLLQQREVDRLILAGQVTEQCVLYTALDAYVRHYSVCVPSDAVAPIDPELGDAALRMMHRNMRAEIVTAADLLDRTAPACRRAQGLKTTLKAPSSFFWKVS
jgi:nicotinamidase-related amidase